MAIHHEHVVGDNEIELEETEEFFPVAIDPVYKGEVELLEQELSLSPLSPLEMQIAEEKLNNVTNKDIAKRLGVSDKVVRVVLGRTSVKRYIREVFDSVTSADKEQRMQLMAALIEQKMATEGITSKLDLAQLIQMLDSMGKVKEQADVGSQGNIMVNILNNLRKD